MNIIVHLPNCACLCATYIKCRKQWFFHCAAMWLAHLWCKGLQWRVLSFFILLPWGMGVFVILYVVCIGLSLFSKITNISNIIDIIVISYHGYFWMFDVHRNACGLSKMLFSHRHFLNFAGNVFNTRVGFHDSPMLYVCFWCWMDETNPIGIVAAWSVTSG